MYKVMAVQKGALDRQADFPLTPFENDLGMRVKMLLKNTGNYQDSMRNELPFPPDVSDLSIKNADLFFKRYGICPKGFVRDNVSNRCVKSLP